MKRYPIIDALRFALAFWVLIGHSFDMAPHVQSGAHTLGRSTLGVWSTAVYATPAVIVFFVISGFCIHIPFRGAGDLPVVRFYLRRYIRILIPVAASLILYRVCVGRFTLWGPNSILWASVLWSVLCEEIYYALYPALRQVHLRWGWKPILVGAFGLSIVVSRIYSQADDFGQIGPLATAAILLPVWILGCQLAEEVAKLPPIRSSREIWLWRGGVWLASWVCEMLQFHAHLYKTQTLAWFGVLFYFWIKKELQYSAHRAPSHLLVSFGAWSYSVYLVHRTILDLISRHHLLNLAQPGSWIVLYGLVLAGCYLFGIAVERPSHRLARRVKLGVSRPLRLPDRAAAERSENGKPAIDIHPIGRAADAPETVAADAS